MDDNYSLWERHDREREALLERLPVCDYCHDPIQDEYLYVINGDFICETCLERLFRKETADFTR